VSGEATGRCPACGEQLTRKRATGLILKNRFLLLEPGDKPRIVIGCPKCEGELELVTKIEAVIVARENQMRLANMHRGRLATARMGKAVSAL